MEYLPGVNRPVDTGDTYFGEIRKIDKSGAVYARTLNRNRYTKLDIADTIPARIDHSRWIVDCPNCNSAEFAFEDRLFVCSICNNSDVGGKARRVDYPKNRKAIENALRRRPIVNRHWRPGETVADLNKENAAMGVL